MNEKMITHYVGDSCHGGHREAISFSVPLPPRALRVNRSRGAHWATKHKAAGEYSEEVYAYFVGAATNFAPDVMSMAWYGSDPKVVGRAMREKGFPWEKARVTYVWRYASVAPDIDNIAGSLKVLQDCLCVAPAGIDPKHQLKDRWYLGIVRDDRAIEATFKREKVKHRAEEGVEVEISRT